MNYVTQTFDFVKRGFAFGYNALCDILDAVGLPHQTFFLLLVAFAIVTFLVSSVMSTFRGSADSAMRLHGQYQAKQAAQARKSKKGGD